MSRRLPWLLLAMAASALISGTLLAQGGGAAPDAGSADTGSADGGAPAKGGDDAAGGASAGGDATGGAAVAAAGDAGVGDAGVGDAGVGDAGVGDAGVGDGGVDGDAGAAAKIWTSCTEYLPKGATPPRMIARMPPRGVSGYAVPLTVDVTHGPGETVMPGGVRIARGSEAIKALDEAKWYLPNPEGGSAPSVERIFGEDGDDEIVTRVTIPLVPLPEEGGRNKMTLPPLPISVGRANGQVMTLCTPPINVTVDDPIANELDPKVRPNPPPRPQREEWTLARNLTFGGIIVLFLSTVIAFIITWWRNRPQPEPEKPKELPWVVAMRELDALRTSTLLDDGNVDEFFDRVDHCCRQYLGDRYGFDGLESTTEEMRKLLDRVYPPIKQIDRVNSFLDDSDFIKYAEVTPTREDCEKAFERAELIVRSTIPPRVNQAEPGAEATGSPPRSKRPKKKKPRKGGEGRPRA